MKAPNLEVLGRDPNSLARSSSVTVNGSTFQTPEIALGIPTHGELTRELLTSAEFRKRSTFIEVYRSLSVDRLNACVEAGVNSPVAYRLSNEIGLALRRGQEIGGIPILMISLTDNNRNPLNGLPPKRELDFVWDLLWRPENKVIVPPIVGVLDRPALYSNLLDSMRSREETVQERFVMPVIPSTYRSITEDIIGVYWKAGARMFAADLQGRGFAANAPTITLIQRTLGRHSRSAREPFLLHALNSRERIGVRMSSRSNWLLGSAFGFDTVGNNHSPPRGFATTVDPHEEVARVTLLQSRDYGYYSIRELLSKNLPRELVETDTPPFGTTTLEALSRSRDPLAARLAAKHHNLAKSLRETKRMQAQLAVGKFESFIRKKERVAPDYELAREVVSGLRVKTLD